VAALIARGVVPGFLWLIKPSTIFPRQYENLVINLPTFKLIFGGSISIYFLLGHVVKTGAGLTYSV